jgi:hypothetical protein
MQRDEARSMHDEETQMMVRKVNRLRDELTNYKVVNFGLREYIKKRHSRKEEGPLRLKMGDGIALKKISIVKLIQQGGKISSTLFKYLSRS